MHLKKKKKTTKENNAIYNTIIYLISIEKYKCYYEIKKLITMIIFFCISISFIKVALFFIYFNSTNVIDKYNNINYPIHVMMRFHCIFKDINFFFAFET